VVLEVIGLAEEEFAGWEGEGDEDQAKRSEVGRG